MSQTEPTKNDAAPEVPSYPKRHPAGLWVLFTTEMWERFCYYGMRAFLIYYLIAKSTADNPGLGWSEKDAYNLYGIFTGLVYLVPLLGGFIADRFIGQHRSVFWGGVIMACGEFILASTEFFRKGNGIPVNFTEDPIGMSVFYLGLFMLIVGTGFFKPCISVMVGQLYGKDDPRRDGAFTIFYMGINLGACLAPLIAGGIAEAIGWNYGFMVAGFGMVFGLITYSTLRPKFLAHIGLPPQKESDSAGKEISEAQREEIRKAEYERTRPLTRVDYDRIFVIAILVFFTIAFWSAFEQAGSSLSVFAKKETDRRVAPIVQNAPIVKKSFLKNEFASDLKDAVEGYDSLNSTVIDMFQKQIEQRKIEKEYQDTIARTKRLKEDAENAEKSFSDRASENLAELGKMFRGELKPEKQWERDLPIDSVVKELIDKANKSLPVAAVVPPPIVLSKEQEGILKAAKDALAALEPGESDDKEGGKEDEPKKDHTVKLESLRGLIDEITVKIPAGTVPPDRESYPYLSEAEKAEKLKEKAEKKLIIADTEYDTNSDKIRYALAFKLSAGDMDTLSGTLSKYPGAMHQMKVALEKTNTMYKPGEDVTTFPATWYQSVNALAIVIFAPLFAMLWAFLAAKKIQPSTPVKFGIGLLLLSTSFIVMVPGAVEAKRQVGLAAPYWLVFSFVLATWGELCVSPVGLSMITKLSPARFGSFMMGVWFLSSALANYLSGALAAWLGTNEDGTSRLKIYFGDDGGMADFFLLIAIIPAIAGLIVLILSPILKKKMHGIH